MKMLKFIINHKYKENMSPEDLYDITRQAWAPQNASYERRQVEEYGYAVAVADYIVREVYKIHKWEPVMDDGVEKWRFIGELADESLHSQCIGKEHRNEQGNQSPVVPITLDDLR